MMMRGVIKTTDRELIERLTVVLKEQGAFPRAVHWNVSLPDGGKLEPPLIGFNLDESTMAATRGAFARLGIEVYVLPIDPVADHAFSPDDIAGDKYVVVKWMPPMVESLAIVDVEDTQFVSILDMAEFPIERENELLVAEICTALQLAANEMNRLRQQATEALAGPMLTPQSSRTQ